MKKVVSLFVILMAIAPSLALAGYLVNHERRLCQPVEGPPGFGISGWEYAETCPDGYTIYEPPVPWWQKLLDLLDTWLGLKNKVIWLPSAGQIAFVTSLVLLLRRLGQLPILGGLLERYTHGLYTIAVSAIVSFWTVIEPQLGGGLTLYEAVGALLATVAGAAGLWEVIKRLVRR